MNFSTFDLIDQNDDGDIDRFDNDMVDGSDVTRSWPGDTVTVNVPGVGIVTYVGTTFYLADGRQVFTPTDGQVLQNGVLVSATGVTTEGPLDVGDLGPPCFTPGTMIETDTGERRVEDLLPGDLVLTKDNGLQAILWIGRTTVRAIGDFAPIRFAPGALGNTRTLLVSPQHRMLIDDWRADYFCGCHEVFAAAKHLVNGTTVTRVEGGVVDYIHLLFERHEVVWSEGIPSESYFPEHALNSADRAARAELTVLFGHHHEIGHTGVVARPVSRKREAQMIAMAA
ncbi:MAG: Hint domain-containing protein [Rhodobacteraceae bacterium]|nr:Hint domain-containing protein [Paracoccaceae bacterium]